MILNRIEPGTECTVRNSGLRGKVNKVYFYPTKFEVEFPDGSVQHLSSKDLEFDGIKQEKASLQVPAVPKNQIGDSWSDWSPFQSESLIEYHFSSTKEIMWKILTSLEMYNVWFHGIQRALPVLEEERFVHKYCFSKLKLKPGAFFKIRPKTLAPWFKCRIVTCVKNKEFGFHFKTNPFVTEYVNFSIAETDLGVWVTCTRKSSGLLSILDQLNWQHKSKILQKLNDIVPKVDLTKDEDSIGIEDKKQTEFGGFSSKQDYIDFAINMGMKGDMDFVNNIPEKTIRGMAKAGIVKSKRTGVLPPLPKKSSNKAQPDNLANGLSSLSREDLIAYLVNKGLDGDMDMVNNHDDKIVRAKTKAMIMKVKKGTVERPAMPSVSEDINGSSSVNSGGGLASLSTEEMVAYLANKGLDGDMDMVNNHDDKIVRAKTKAMIMKVKKGTVERPAMPNIKSDSQENENNDTHEETNDQKIDRLIAKGVQGEMDEINALTDKVLRGKIKAGIIKAKRAKK